MCTNLKLIKRNGIRKEDNYRGKKGEKWDIEAYMKCGFCEECRNEKANNWAIRNKFEAEEHEEKCFLTLTYAETDGYLHKKHLQDFNKRLRAYLDYNYKIKIRTFNCGEFGDLRARPHKHIIVYGWNDKDKKFIEYNKKGNAVYESEIISLLWGKGRTTIQEYSQAEIPYISLYSTPKEQLARPYKKILSKFNKLKNKQVKFYIEMNYGKISKIPEQFYNDTKQRVNKEFYEAVKKRDKKILTFKFLIDKITIEKIFSLYGQYEQEKEKYNKCKPYNTWSRAIGWKAFKKQYKKGYVFKEYVGNYEFRTPSPWLKKLANKELDESAKEELFKREEEAKKIYEQKNADNLMEESASRNQREAEKRRNEWNDRKNNTEIF